MTTPQETRDRIEEMRNRIFNGSNLDPVKNKIEEIPQDDNLAKNTSNLVENSGFASKSSKSNKSSGKSSSKKINQKNERNLIGAGTKTQFSEIALEFDGKIGSLEIKMLDKLERISVNLGKVEGQIENQIGELDTSLQKYVSSIRASQEEKIESLNREVLFLQDKLQSDVSDIKDLFLEQQPHYEKIIADYKNASNKKIDNKTRKIQNNLNSLKEEIFESQKDLITDFDKKLNSNDNDIQIVKKKLESSASKLLRKIKDSEIKTHDYLSKKISDAREVLSSEVKALSEELAILNDIIKEKHFELTTHVDMNLAAVTTKVGEDFDNLKETLSKESTDLSKHFEKEIEKSWKEIDKKTNLKQVEEFFNEKLTEKLNKFSTALEERFGTISENIQSVESMIVKEEDLTKLFQNYTLNVNISGEAKAPKTRKLSKNISPISALKKVLPNKKS